MHRKEIIINRTLFAAPYNTVPIIPYNTRNIFERFLFTCKYTCINRTLFTTPYNTVPIIPYNTAIIQTYSLQYSHYTDTQTPSPYTKLSSI